MKTWIKAALCSLALAGASPLVAEPLKIATIAPEGSIWHQQLMQFVQAVHDSSELELEVFAGGQLGNMADTLKGTLSGRVDIWVGAMPVVSAVTPELGLFNLPYLFETSTEAKCAVPRMVQTARDLAGKKYHLLNIAAVGSQDVNAATPIRTPGDLRGLKIRTAPIPASMAFFQSMGATPQALPASETPSAVSTGLVEAVDFDVVYYALSGVYKTVSYHTPTRHNLNLGAYIVSPRTWAGLSPSQKAALQAAADSMRFDDNLDAIEVFQNTMLQRVAMDGVTIVELTQDETAQWVQAGRAIWDQVIAGTRGDAPGFMAALDDARGACR